MSDQRATKKHKHIALKESGKGIHTACGCVIPWITKSGKPAATYKPAAVAPKPVCPKCEAFIDLFTKDNATDDAVTNSDPLLETNNR